jgi:hypothetical protein
VLASSKSDDARNTRSSVERMARGPGADHNGGGAVIEHRSSGVLTTELPLNRCEACRAVKDRLGYDVVAAVSDDDVAIRRRGSSRRHCPRGTPVGEQQACLQSLAAILSHVDRALLISQLPPQAA